jgi:hypothetical protein
LQLPSPAANPGATSGCPSISISISIFVWGFVIEQSVGGIYSSAQRYFPYTAAGSLAGTKLGSENSPLPFAAAAGLLLVVATVISVITARTTLRAEVT